MQTISSNIMPEHLKTEDGAEKAVARPHIDSQKHPIPPSRSLESAWCPKLDSGCLYRRVWGLSGVLARSKWCCIRTLVFHPTVESLAA